jgi:hypothetical protein
MMTEYFEIIPGESIGPFKLGMTREQIEELDIRPRRDFKDGTGAHYPLLDMDEEEIPSGPSPGVNVHYDASGTCHRLQALFAYWPCPPVFTLCGHVTNGMTQDEAVSIFRSMASDVKVVYATVYAPSAGIRATKWERIDDHIMAITVVPKTETASQADRP